MTPDQRVVRAAAYAHFIETSGAPTVQDLAERTAMPIDGVHEALRRLHNEHRLVVAQDGRVLMAHPFSGSPTMYRAVSGGRSWDANCGWDVFAILSIMGDGTAETVSPVDDSPRAWRVRDGIVEPEGLVHFVVPARSFWDDIEFT